MPIHRAESCTQREVTCHLCGQTILAINIHTHLEQHTSCLQCDQLMFVPDSSQSVKHHRLTTCPLCTRPVYSCCVINHIFFNHLESITLSHHFNPPDSITSLTLIDDQSKPSITRSTQIFKSYTTFSSQYKHSCIQLTEEARIAKRTQVQNEMKHGSVLINHPNINEGVWAWEFQVLDIAAYVVIGASPPMCTGDYPGDNSMPGSIGIDSLFGQLWVDSDFPDEGFEFAMGDRIILLLDFNDRVVGWRHGDGALMKTAPLPLPGPYVPAVGLLGQGSAVSILSCCRIE
eukprot:gnl/Dysnectes_brevis/11219_a23358_121.p1 GENE.gnl/Dysnectes_brevis/11219_a23358_121~~gnl/Dysnectes_brevis/11219_a23358_121.p1  ORF type:complete len:288 (-),score=18.40 gnl/Dysnectes_brevis/11219_a23358_121:80-943(-)